jgi:hypothetical protein
MRLGSCRIDAVDLCLGKLEDTHKQLLKNLFLPNQPELRFDKTEPSPFLLNDFVDSCLPNEKYLVRIDTLVALHEIFSELYCTRRVSESTVKVKNNFIPIWVGREGLEEVVEIVLRGAIENTIF